MKGSNALRNTSMQLLMIRSKSTNGKKAHHAMEAVSQENQLQNHNTTVAQARIHCRPKPVHCRPKPASLSPHVSSLSPHVSSLSPQARIHCRPMSVHCRPMSVPCPLQASITVVPQPILSTGKYLVLIPFFSVQVMYCNTSKNRRSNKRECVQ